MTEIKLNAVNIATLTERCVEGKVLTTLIDISDNVCYDSVLIRQLHRRQMTMDYSTRGGQENDRLVEAVSDHYGVPFNNVAIGFGIADILNRTIQAVGSYASVLCAISPTWMGIETACRQNFLTCQKSRDYVYGDILYIANPNGRTGKVVPAEELIEKCKSYHTVIVDEAYGEYAAESLIGRHDMKNLIVMKTLSKSVASTGLRFGYCFAHETMIKKIRMFEQKYNATAMSHALVPYLLNQIEPHTARMKKTKAWLEENFKCAESHSNFVRMSNPPQWILDNFNVAKIGRYHRITLVDLGTIQPLYSK